MQKIIQQGAEAVIILEDGKIIKKRNSKSYRLKKLDDRIRKLRTRAEGKLLEKASQVAKIPKLEKTDEKERQIIMEFIDGKKLSENLNEFSLEEQKQILTKVGEAVAKLHDKNIIHGDLTTSNMILKNKKIYFIDFGLGFISRKYEDKAVDLHLLKEALEAKHFENWKKLFSSFLNTYKNSKDSEKVLQRLKKVEKRGRYKF